MMMMMMMETETRDDTPRQRRRRGATMGRALGKVELGHDDRRHRTRQHDDDRRGGIARGE